MNKKQQKFFNLNQRLKEVERQIKQECDEIYALNKPILDQSYEYDYYELVFDLSIYFSKMLSITIEDHKGDKFSLIDIDKKCLDMSYFISYDPEHEYKSNEYRLCAGYNEIGCEIFHECYGFDNHCWLFVTLIDIVDITDEQLLLIDYMSIDLGIIFQECVDI